MKQNLEKEYIPGIGKGVVVSTIGQIVEKGVGFLFNLILPILIGISNFGIYTIGISLTHLATIISFGGLTKGIIKKGSDFFNEKKYGKLFSLIKFSLFFSLGVVLFFILLFFTFSEEISWLFFKSKNYGWVIKLLSLSIPFTLITGLLLSFTVSLKIIRYSIFVKNILEPILKLIIFLILFGIGLKLSGAVISFSTTMAICTVISIFFFLKTKSKLPHVKAEKIDKKEILFFSLPLTLTPTLFYNLLMWINILIIGAFDTNYKVGLLSLGYKISLISLIFINGFTIPIEPRISDFIHVRDFEGLKNLHHSIVRWIFLIGSPVMFFLTFFSKETLFFINSKFFPAWIFLTILSVGSIFIFIGSPSLSIIVMSGKSMWQLLNTIFLLTTNVFISIILSHYYKAMGIAFSIVITYFLFSLITSIEIKKLYKYIPIPFSLIKILFFNTIPFLTIILLKKILYVPFLFYFIIFFTLYFAAYLIFENKKNVKSDLEIIKNTYLRILDHIKNPDNYL